MIARRSKDVSAAEALDNLKSFLKNDDYTSELNSELLFQLQQTATAMEEINFDNVEVTDEGSLKQDKS